MKKKNVIRNIYVHKIFKTFTDLLNCTRVGTVKISLQKINIMCIYTFFNRSEERPY